VPLFIPGGLGLVLRICSCFASLLIIPKMALGSDKNWYEALTDTPLPIT